MSQSSHGKVGRTRKPRVHITYDVQIGDAIEKQELPFIVGAMGDYSGDPTATLPPLKERKFVQIDKFTFDKVMKKMNAGLNLRVENTLAGDGSEMAVQLKFEALEDFSPEKVADQVEPLKKLLDSRQKIVELINKIERSDPLGDLLSKVLNDEATRSRIAGELNLPPDQAGDQGGDQSES